MSDTRPGVTPLLTEFCQWQFQFFLTHVICVVFGFLVTQSADDEILVRDVLYDSLILVDYSFINNGAGVDLLPVYVSRLIITLDAVNDAR
jgi:hypothetical protein